MTDRLRWRIDKDGQGMGGFLAPPGHPDHEYVVIGKRPRAREADMMTGVGSVLDNPDQYPEHVVRMAQRVMDAAELRCSELWIRSVYGYFHTMYVPESGDRRAAYLLTDPKNTLPPERHAAVATIRQWFPDHEPRTDLIINPAGGYGLWPCIHCGLRVQYAARCDALAVVTPGAVWRYDTDCPDNAEGHQVDAAPEPETDEEVFIDHIEEILDELAEEP
jgi:hypothetical protein